MERAIRKWAGSLQSVLPEDEVERLISCVAKSYTIYGSMLLLSPRSLDQLRLPVNTPENDSNPHQKLLDAISKELKISHIAVNRPIPLHQDRSGQDSQNNENVLRAPLNFTPLYGDFGPATCSSPPSQKDFTLACWVTAKQNGIAQTWAPRWTMFSRGNISEKARLLTLPSVTQAVQEGEHEGTGCTAVDLYAGIGYFAFSYAKAGCRKVLCWDLNEWSCEGLRRGAKANKWKFHTNDGNVPPQAMLGEDTRFVVFNESNDLALDRIEAMRTFLPPIRHVNCGLLPSSKGSWAIAFAALDPRRGGWIHVHANFAQQEIELEAEKVTEHFQRLLDEFEGVNGRAKLANIHRVKTYAPGVYHCVLDICIPPRLHDQVVRPVAE